MVLYICKKNSTTITANKLQGKEVLHRGQILMSTMSTGTTTDHSMSYLKQWTKKIPTGDQVDQSTKHLNCSQQFHHPCLAVHCDPDAVTVSDGN